MRVAAAALALALSAFAQAEFPDENGPVVDDAGAMSGAAFDELAAELIDFESRTGDRIAVVTVTSTGDEPIDSYAAGLFNFWELTDQDALLVIAVDDRAVWLIAPLLAESTAAAIVDNDVLPRLDEGDVDSAARDGAFAIRQELDSGTGDVGDVAESQEPSGGIGLAGGVIVALAVVVGALYLAKMARQKGGHQPRWRRNRQSRAQGRGEKEWSVGDPLPFDTSKSDDE